MFLAPVFMINLLLYIAICPTGGRVISYYGNSR